MKQIFNIYYLYNMASYILYFSKFIFFINYTIILYIINQFNAAIKNQINNIINILSKNLYLIIAIIMQNFNILIQTF